MHQAAEGERYTIACANVRIAVAEMLEENGKCSSSGQHGIPHLRHQMKDKIGLGQVRKKVNRLGVHVRERVQTFETFARQHAYIRVNEKLVDRILKRLPERKRRYGTRLRFGGRGLIIVESRKVHEASNR